MVHINRTKPYHQNEVLRNVEVQKPLTNQADPNIDMKEVNFIEQLCCLGSHTHVSKTKAHTAAIATNSITTTQNPTEQKGEETWINNTIRLYYAPLLMKFEVKLITCLLYIIYLAAALYGCSVTQLGLEPIKLLVEDSYTIKYYQAMEELSKYAHKVSIRRGMQNRKNTK
uniref:Uncharacterized protein n=1 Tax=Romanomermis culicivorax TaxID=13658 RepID=A0A915ICF2_ROMCU